VQCQVRHASDPPAPYTGVKVEVTIVELLPVTLADAAPTLPSFSVVGDITSTKLNQLAAYVAWLIRRVGVRYDPLMVLNIRRGGPFCIPITGTNPNVLWRGAIRKTPLHTTLRLRGNTYRIWTGATEEIRLRVNGSQVGTVAVPATLGESGWSFDYSLSGFSTDALIPVTVQYVRTAPVLDDQPINHWTVNEAYVDAASGGAATLAAWTIRQAGVAGTSIVTWLQSARTLAAAIKARIDANGGMWAVQRCSTMRTGFDIGQLQAFEELSMPANWRRVGDALVGRGRALSLGYGAGWFDDAAHDAAAKGIGGVGAWPVKNARTATLVDGGEVGSFQYFLDDAPGLPPGAPFNVRGWESYVLMERLKVVD